MLTHLSLFTGIGGIDLAAEWAGFTTVGQCEWADYPTRVLEKHWPDVPRWRDVRDVTADSVRSKGIGEITLLSGGFPCQPHSVAGKRRASDDERDLWPELARVIGELKPRWFLGENVPGLLTSETGRFFGRVLGDLASLGYRVGWTVYGAKDVGAIHRRDRVFIVAYSNSEGLERRTKTFDSFGEREKSAEEQLSRRDIGDIGIYVPNTNDRSWPVWGNGKFSTTEKTDGNGSDNGRRAEEHVTGEWWAVEPNVGRVAYGVPNRVDRLKCLGNAVVPQQVYPILKVIADTERSEVLV